MKGRIASATDFGVTRNGVFYGKNAERYRLALVTVSPDGPDHDEVRYVLEPFRGLAFGDFTADGVRGDWAQMWSRGQAPL